MYKYRLFKRQNKETVCSLRCELIVGTPLCGPMRPAAGRGRDSPKENTSSWTMGSLSNKRTILHLFSLNIVISVLFESIERLASSYFNDISISVT